MQNSPQDALKLEDKDTEMEARESDCYTYVADAFWYIFSYKKTSSPTKTPKKQTDMNTTRHKHNYTISLSM